jgi:phytoene/squalene synthetase
VLHVFGAATPERMGLSDHVCTGLQLVEHWQDVAEDVARGRVYLPQEDLRRFGVPESALSACRPSPELRRLMAFEVRRAHERLDAGAPLVGTLRGLGRVMVAAFLAGGRAALAAIADRDYDVLAGPPRGRRARLARELVLAAVRGR